MMAQLHLLWSKKIYIISVLMLLFVSACADVPNLLHNASGGGSSADKKELLPNFPIPPKSSFLPEESLILGRDDEWTGKIIISSSLPVERLFEFYKNQMPLADWVELTELQGASSHLIFSKDSRIANISITSGNLSGSKATILVSPNSNETSF